MFEELKDKKIRRLKTYKAIISSFKAVGYDIVDDIELVKFLDDIYNLEEFKRSLSSIGVLCSAKVLSKLENMNYIIKNDKREDIKNALEKLSKEEKQSGIELPVILTEGEIELRKEEEEERHLQEEIKREERRFNEIKNNSSDINYIFVGTESVNYNFKSGEKRQECAKYFDKNGNRIDSSKCAKLFNYTKNICNTHSKDEFYSEEDMYLVINTESESRCLFKTNDNSIFGSTLYFSGNITNDDLERMYYMLSGNYRSLKIFKEYLLNAFKEKEYLISLVEKRLNWLENIGQHYAVGDYQIYNFGDIQILFKCDRYDGFPETPTAYRIKIKMKNENDWKNLYHNVERTTGVVICEYAYKSEVIEKLGIDYIRENLGTDYDRHMFDCYVVDSKYCTIDETIGNLEYTAKTR